MSVDALLLKKIAKKLPKLPTMSAKEQKDYGNLNLPRQKLILNLLLGLIFALSFLSIIVNPKKKYFAEFYIYEGITITVTCFIFLISRRKEFRPENSQCILNFCVFFLFSEGLINEIQKGARLPCFKIGIYTDMLILSLIIAKVRWFKTIVFTWTCSLFCIFRYLPFQEPDESIFFPVIHVILNLIIMSTISFVIEKEDKEKFISNSKKEFSLNCFRELITEVFPSPIIIAIGEEIAFKNDEVSKILNCHKNLDVLKQLELISLDSPADNVFGSFQAQSFEIEKINLGKQQLEGECLKPSLGFEPDAKNSDKEFNRLSLRDVLRISKEVLKTKRSFTKQYMSIYKPYNEESSEFKQYFDVYLKNIVWEGKNSLMIILTENKTFQDIKFLKQESLYKDNLLATVSHDLRTPINGVIGILNETAPLIQDVTINKNLGIALRSAKYLIYMVNDILDFHQIANKKLRLNFEYASLWEVIKEVSKLVGFQAKLKGLNFIKENRVSMRNSRAVLRTDPNRLKQVILNLLGNALKFTTQGSIRICLEEVKPERDEILPGKGSFNENFDYKISVADTGTGIKNEDIGKLFKLFGKLEDKRSTLNKSGVGLGLAISQNLVKMLNKNEPEGEIKVISEYGKGSLFFFYLKSHLEEDYANLSQPSEGDLAKEVLDFGGYVHSEEAKKTISQINSISLRTADKAPNYLTKEKRNLLIVDDDQINIVVATSYLKGDPNFKYDIASNGLQAVKIIKDMAALGIFYDIVLMDCNMPIMDGFQASEIVLDFIKCNVIPDLVIIACTADSTASVKELCFKSGMKGFLTKPFLKKEFLSVLDKYSKKEV